jgi:predicted transglutaminase-like cysteine proteinase
MLLLLRLLARAIAASSLLAMAPAAAAPPVLDQDYPPLFGSREVRNTNLVPFQKWTGMLARQIDERTLYDGPCTARRFNRCHLQEWRTLLHGLAGQPPAAQVAAVNEFMNRAPYVTDPVNYGVPDYWATPIQFLSKDGDCEDYAIAKFISLRELGFTNEQMRIVVLDDLNLKIAHAILVVYLDGKALVLDNQIASVIQADRIRHYKPIYSINENSWWLHRP